MNRRTFASLIILAGGLSAGLFSSGDAAAVVSNADYTAVPPFVSSTTTPNIIILMDNSGSMSNRACESTSCGTLADGSTSTSTTWTNTTRYSGYFDSPVAIPTTRPTRDLKVPRQKHTCTRLVDDGMGWQF